MSGNNHLAGGAGPGIGPGIRSVAAPAMQIDNVASMMAAVEGNGFALQHASANVRDNKQVVLRAVTNVGNALQYASEGLRADPDVVMCAVDNYGFALRHAALPLRNNPAIVLRAVAQYYDALMYASEELRSNKEFVKRVISRPNCGYALRCASPELRDDAEMMRLAIEHETPNGGVTLCYASDKWLRDKEFAHECITRNWANWNCMAPELKRDRGLVLAAIESARVNHELTYNIVEHMDPLLRADKEVMLAAVARNAAWYVLAAPELRRDPDMVRTALATGCRINDAETQIFASEMQKLLAAVPAEFRNGAYYDTCVQRVSQLAVKEAAQRAARAERDAEFWAYEGEEDAQEDAQPLAQDVQPSAQD